MKWTKPQQLARAVVLIPTAILFTLWLFVLSLWCLVLALLITPLVAVVAVIQWQQRKRLDKR